MSCNLFTRRRQMQDQQITEPTLLAITLTAAGLSLLLIGCAVGMMFLPMYGHIWWAFAVLAMVLVGMLVWGHRKLAALPTSVTRWQRWFGRILRGSWLILIGVLAGWLVLIVWLAICPDGTVPPAKTAPQQIRVVTWNIHCGCDDGLPWKRFDWPARKSSLRTALEQVQPDILCVQEATPEQVEFLEACLPGHCRVGVGRDDGKSAGEHCAIYFDRQRFKEIGNNTFWLEEPIDEPRPATVFSIKRICTWVRLRDQLSQRTLRVYNTHLYLTERYRLRAAEHILKHVDNGDQADAIILTADFNATPSSPSRRAFCSSKARLAECDTNGEATFQLYGIGVRCIDGILLSPHWHVQRHWVLRVKPDNVFPSDHFGLLADLHFAKE